VSCFYVSLHLIVNEQVGGVQSSRNQRNRGSKSSAVAIFFVCEEVQQFISQSANNRLVLARPLLTTHHHLHPIKTDRYMYWLRMALFDYRLVTRDNCCMTSSRESVGNIPVLTDPILHCVSNNLAASTCDDIHREGVGVLFHCCVQPIG
jgi:hypothetical protein